MRDIIVAAANLAVLAALSNSLSDLARFRKFCRLHLAIVEAEQAAGALSEWTLWCYELSIAPMRDQERTALILSALSNATILPGSHRYAIYRWLPADYGMLTTIIDGERRLVDAATTAGEALMIIESLAARLGEMLEAASAYDRAMM